MTDAKRLLDEATPLPWTGRRWMHEYGYGYFHALPKGQGGITTPDLRLIDYAVNRLPDYEALIPLLEAAQTYINHFVPVEAAAIDGFDVESWATEARAALARLRETEAVPA